MWLNQNIIGLFLMAVQCLADSKPSVSDFLQSTMHKIQRERLGLKEEETVHTTHLDQDSTHQPSFQSHFQEDAERNVPEETDQLTIAKDQLLALYHAAVNKGAKLKLGDLPSFHSPNDVADDTTYIQSTEQGQIPGYYYYFYPIKSFMAEMTKEPETSETMNTKNKGNEDKNKDMMLDDIPKTIEPLFTAMASFVGVAMMFIFTILFLPKFGVLKSRGIIFKEGSEEFLTFTKILSESFQGKDCSQKIACHVGKTLRNMHMGTKTIKILELMLPQHLANQLARIRRSAAKKEKCHYLKCKGSPKDKEKDDDR